MKSRLKSLRPLLAAVGLATLASVAASQAQTATACAQVEVKNVRPQQGYLMLAAYGDADSYNKKPLTSMRLPAGDAVMSFEVCGLVGDSVALALFQDLDSDGKMGRNLLGVPLEPWGGSGTPGAFGPTWDSTRVPLDGKTIIVLMSN